MHRVYVPRWKVTNDSLLEDSYVCHDLTDCLAPPALFAQLRAMDYDQLYSEFNVGGVRQVCLGGRGENAGGTYFGEERDQAAEDIRLRGQLTTVEAADAAKGSELKDLKEKNFVLEGEREMLFAKLTSDLSDFQLSRDELNSKVASLESERDGLINQLFSACMEATQDERARVLGNKVAELDAQLLEMAAHLDEEFYPRFLTAISGRRWILTDGLKLVILKCLQSPMYYHALGLAIGCAVNKGIQDGLRAGVDHGKDGRDLFVIKAYDPSAEAKYVEAVNALGTVDFSLLSELKSKKDASIVDLMDSIRLEGPLAEIPRAEDLQPSPEQLRLLIHRLEDNVVLGETSLSFSLQVVHSQVQRIKGEIMEKRLSLTDVMAPLAEPLSSRSLIGEASTSAIPSTVEPVTTLSTTLASSGFVPLLSISDYQVLDAEPHHENPPTVNLEEEELDMTREQHFLRLQKFHVRGKMLSLQSLSLYAPFLNASVTSYGPSHLGPSLPPSSAWLASLLR
ncbi:hypothetical protein Tco_1476713 [Tanacetum coccineum]